MKIKMLETHRVSEDGFVLRLLEAGKVYDVADTAARACVMRGWALGEGCWNEDNEN